MNNFTEERREERRETDGEKNLLNLLKSDERAFLFTFVNNFVHNGRSAEEKWRNHLAFVCSCSYIIDRGREEENGIYLASHADFYRQRQRIDSMIKYFSAFNV